MAEQTSRLAIIIDSTGAERNADSLASALGKMTQAGDQASNSANRMKKATKEEADALSDLLDRIDPVNAALNKLDKQQQELSKFKAKGMIDTETFDNYSKQIEDTRNRLTGFSDQLNKTGMSAKQTAAAMRMVPAQFTDIFVSLASGQAPLTVLLQQGGQLKDMFGGIGPAARALGGYITGLINPFTLAAGAVGILGYAYYQGSKEQDEFFKSLTLTGNQVGKTSGQLADIAARISTTNDITTGSAAAVLNQLVSSGKVAGDSLERVTTAIVKASDITGIATSSLVDDFNKIAADPVEAISKLNEQYNFLTAATYNQIKALQGEGNQLEAAKVASDAYANSWRQRSESIKENLGVLETAWNSLGLTARQAWNSMLNIGREQTLEEKLADAERALENARSSKGLGNGFWNTYGMNYQGGETAVDDAQRQVDLLRSQITTESVLTGIISDHQKQEQKLIKTQQEADRVNQQYLSNADRRAKAIKQQDEFLKAGAISAAEYEKNIGRINEMYKDPEKPKGRAFTEDAGTRMLDQLRQQQQVLMSQADTGEKIGTQQQALIKWEQQLSDLKSKGTLTADQKSLLANQDKITALYQQNAALEKQTQLLKQASQLAGYQSALDRDRGSKQLQYGAEELAASGAMSSYQQGILTQRASLEQQLNDKLIQLRQQRTSATTDIDKQTIDKEIVMQQDANERMLADYDKHVTQMDQSRRSFSAGAARAWNEYQDSAANASAMSQQLFTSAFSGMEDAIVKFATTGKASFKDFATSVISDLARIAARQAIAGIGSSIFGSVLSAGVSAATGSVGSTPSGAYDNAAAGLKFNAKGGVYDSPSLSNYSNGIYNSPQFFAFAKGAGVFAEAGPEAIMPLARGANGSLGVRAIGASSSAPAVSIGDINVTISGESQSAEVSNQSTADSARQLQGIILRTVTDWAKREITPGGILYKKA